MLKSIRLNKNIRNQIVNAIMEAYEVKNPKPAGNTPSSCKETLEKTLSDIYLAKTKDIESKAEKAGLTEYLSKVSYKYVYKDGNHFITLNFKEHLLNLNPSSSAWIDLETTKIPSIKKAYQQYQEDLKHTKSVVDAIKAWKLAYDNYKTDVENILDGVNTSKQLLDVWPECERFIPKGIVDPSNISLPSVNIANLNSKI